jgi:hypothetical protein
MLCELAEAVEGVTAWSPLLLVLEDLHWSDVSTVDWLAYQARRREGARLLVVGTYRPVEAIVRTHPVRAVIQEFLLHGQCADLALGYLPPREACAIWRTASGRGSCLQILPVYYSSAPLATRCFWSP